MVEKIFEEYLGFLQRAQGLSESSLDCHRRYAGAFLKDLQRQGCLAWKQLTPAHVDSFTRRCCHYARVRIQDAQAAVERFSGLAEVFPHDTAQKSQPEQNERLLQWLETL